MQQQQRQQSRNALISSSSGTTTTTSSSSRRGLAPPLRAHRKDRSPGDRQAAAVDGHGLARAVTAAAVALAALGSGAGAARAAAPSAEWKPRRHHRHIGERFTDTWADAVVEVGGAVCACCLCARQVWRVL